MRNKERELAEKETPFFLIDRGLLEENVRAFQRALSAYWPNSRIAYSVKTNSLPWLLRFMREQGAMAEVVSDEEYELARLCGYDSGEIVYNGPIKGAGLFGKALRSGGYVNLDAERDLEALAEAGSSAQRVGVRVNVPTEIFDPKSVGYMEDGFRFGWSEADGGLARVLEEVRRRCPDAGLGLHLHCNSVTRGVDVYRAIAGYAADLVRKYGLTLSYLDTGGGYFGGVEGKPGPSDYLRVIREALSPAVDPERTELIVEPGSAVIASAAELHTSVTDVKRTGRAVIVTTDGSRVYIDPLWAKSRYLYELRTEAEDTLPRQIVCGGTCVEHDRIMCLEDAPALRAGDRIIYRRVGSYSMTFGGMFIHYPPEVWVDGGDRLERVRSRISVREYYNIQTAGDRL